MKHSDALDLEHDVFKSKDPRKIACSLKHSAEQSHRRKGTPYQSAMSMLNFYINRAGKNLPEKQKRILENAKQEMRDVFGRAQVEGVGHRAASPNQQSSSSGEADPPLNLIPVFA